MTIIRPAKRIEEHKPFIFIEIQVTEKSTGTNKWLGSESIILSDKDYDHFRNILLRAFPEHEWKSGNTTTGSSDLLQMLVILSSGL